MNRTLTRRAGAETDIFLMVGCSVSKAAFLFLIFFKDIHTGIKLINGDIYQVLFYKV